MLTVAKRESLVSGSDFKLFGLDKEELVPSACFFFSLLCSFSFSFSFLLSLWREENNCGFS